MTTVKEEPEVRRINMDDGVEIFVQIEGKRDGKPIVLVHGWMFNHEMWEFQVPYLEKRHKVVTIDLRGFGQSGRLDGSYTYDRWACDVGRVIKELKLQNVTLVGYSLGGATAIYYTSIPKCPPIERLAIIAAPAPHVLPTVAKERELVSNDFERVKSLVESLPPDDRLVDDATRFAVFKELFDIIYPDPKVEPEKLRWYFMWLGGMLKSASKHATLSALYEFASQDLTLQLSDLRVETRIFHGELDIFVRPSLAKEQEELTGVKPVWFPISGHGLFFEFERDKLNKELDRFAAGS
jgi:non-heme chloroperoxidase